ncbi:MAG: choice-of-anchor R domain-containing protein [Patescibacteria group bacterium]
MNNKNKNGFAVLVSILIVSAVASIFVSSFASNTVKNSDIARNYINSEKSYYASESGIEDSIYRIRSGNSYSFSNSLAVGDATTNISISENNNITTIVSDGNSGNAYRKVNTNLTLSASEVDFFYGVQVGDGGLEMDENAEIIGNIQSNGNVSGDSGSKISGDAIVAGGLAESTQARSTVCNTDNLVGQGDPTIDYAQSFNINTNDTLVKVRLYIKKVGNPDSRNVRITTDAGGNPDNSIAQGVLDKNLVTTSYGWVDVTMDTPVLLNASQTYWLVLDASKSASNYWVWCSDSNNGYGNGIGKYSKDWDGNDPWTQIVGDLNFKTYFGIPSGIIDGMIISGDARANTITNSNVCGDAYYQTMDASSNSFLNTPTSPTCNMPLTNGVGYPNATDPGASQMPISSANFNQWKIDAQAGGTITGNYTISSSQSLGPKYITGDLLINSNNKTLTVTGTIYVAGSIDISNGSTIVCAPAYGANSCLVIADSWIHITNNSNFGGSGQSGSFLLLATTSSCTGIVGQTPCTHHDGAVDVHNNATGVIFYASDGMINLHNGVNVTQATAYKLRIDNNSIITYDIGLENARFTSGPSAGWKIYNWKEVQ